MVTTMPQPAADRQETHEQETITLTCPCPAQGSNRSSTSASTRAPLTLIATFTGRPSLR
jgi:hypothetical protein